MHRTFKQRFFHREVCPRGEDGIANNVDPDQTAPLGACLSENLGLLLLSET